MTDGSGTEYAIDGVFADVPENSHWRPTALISMTSHSQANNQNWLSNNFFTYIKLKEGADWKISGITLTSEDRTILPNTSG